MEKRKLNWISSWDDGGLEDLRLAELLKKYKLPGTFYIPSCCDLKDSEIKKLSKDFEIGGHTVSHFHNLRHMDKSTIAMEIMDNKYWLEKLIWKKILPFCYPRGRYDQKLIEIVKQCGFKSARTTKVLATSSGDPYIINPTIHIYPRKEYHLSKWHEVGKMWAQKSVWDSGYFHIWGHSAEISKLKQWDELEVFFKWIKENFIIENEKGF